MKKYINRYVIGAAMLFTVTACTKSLQIEPRASLDVNNALVNATNMETAINSVYASLKTLSYYGRDMEAMSESLGDLFWSNNRGNRFANSNSNNINEHFGFWNAAYLSLGEINLILDAIPKINAPAATKQRWEGEVRFLRALHLHNLVKTYAYDPTVTAFSSQDRGGVVLQLKPIRTIEEAVNLFPKRATVAEVYNQIWSDLYSSVTLLGTSGRTGAQAVVNGYASRMGALALGSRVALHQGNWARSDSFATAAINLRSIGALADTNNYVQQWRLASHIETIFEVKFATNQESLGASESLHGTFTNLLVIGNGSACPIPVVGGFAPLVPTNKLLAELQITPRVSGLSHAGTVCPAPSTVAPIVRGTDVRAELYEHGMSSSGRFIEMTKFIGKNGIRDLDNVPVLRWSELHLNKAEALYRLGQETAALNELNLFRSRRLRNTVANPTLFTGTGVAILNEIMRQRMIEFAGEGYRWFDLKRTATDMTKWQSGTGTSFTLTSNDFKWLARIPQTQIDGNPNMVQNFGW